MKLCSIEMRSEGEGWKSNISAEGKVENNDGVKFFYEVDGDSCTLSYKDGIVTQQRLGEQNITITFQEGIKTYFMLKSGGFSGSYDIFTHRLNFNAGSAEYLLRLEYLNGDEPVKLTFKAYLH